MKNQTNNLNSSNVAHEVAKLKWVHQIDLGNGLVTLGRWTPDKRITRAFDDIDFKGKKVLDIGTWDGLWAF